MNTIVVYISQTGFTKRYAEWIAEELQAEIVELKEAKRKPADFFTSFDAIIYGGWAMGGRIVEAKWFFDKAVAWKEKKLAVFCVGASPAANPDVDRVLHDMLTDEQRTYIKVFYCQGGLNYDKMKLSSKMMMKAFVSMLKKKKDATQMEKDMAAMISESYDISDKCYVEPIVAYVKGE